MAKFNEYPAKTTPKDADKIMLYSAEDAANKLSPFSGIWNWMVNKLTNAVINNLQTSNKTVVGALNELNSNQSKIVSISNVTDIQKIVNNITVGTNVQFHLAGAGYTGNDLPADAKFKYGSGIIFNRNSSSCKIILIPEELNPVWKMSTWTEWRDFANNIVN